MKVLLMLLISCGAFARTHDSGPLVAPITFRPSVYPGMKAAHDASQSMGRLRVTFQVDFYRRDLFTDAIAAKYDVCFSSEQRGLVYCYQAVQL